MQSGAAFNSRVFGRRCVLPGAQTTIRSRRRLAWFAAFLTTCLLTVAGTASLQAAFEQASHVQPGEAAEFELPDVQGKAHRLSSHRGNWVVVNFWASWCGPCIREMPALQAFADSTGSTESIDVIGVNFEDISHNEFAAAVAQLDIRYTNVKAGDQPLIPFEPLQGLPSTFLVSPDGELVYRHVGETTTGTLQAALIEARRRYATTQ